MDRRRDVACYVLLQVASVHDVESTVAPARRCRQRLYARSVLSPPPVVAVEIAPVSVSIFPIMPDIMAVVTQVAVIASQIVLVAANITTVNVMAVLAAIKAVVPKIAPILPRVAAVSAEVFSQRKGRSEYCKAQ